MRTGFHIKNKGSVITPTLCSQCFLGFDLWSVLSDPRPAVEVGGPAWAPRPRRLLLTCREETQEQVVRHLWGILDALTCSTSEKRRWILKKGFVWRNKTNKQKNIKESKKVVCVCLPLWLSMKISVTLLCTKQQRQILPAGPCAPVSELEMVSFSGWNTAHIFNDLAVSLCHHKMRINYFQKSPRLKPATSWKLVEKCLLICLEV